MGCGSSITTDPATHGCPCRSSACLMAFPPPVVEVAPIADVTVVEELGGCRCDVKLAVSGTKAHKTHAFILSPAACGEDWRDLVFLAATATSSHLNEKRPVVLAVGTSLGDWQENDNVQDFLNRMQPSVVHVFRTTTDSYAVDVSSTGSSVVHYVDVKDLKSASLALAALWKTKAKYAVVAPEADYGSALLAASLAARVGAPLLFDCDLDGFDSEPEKVLTVGNVGSNSGSINLPSTPDVIQWLLGNDFPVDYFAVVNPKDRMSGVAPKLSLTAPMYTARRDGIVVPIPDVPIQPPTGIECEPLQAVWRELKPLYSKLGKVPSHMALVGGMDTVPTCEASESPQPPQLVVTDLPYGNAEFDLLGHRHIAVARIFTHNLCMASLLACRTVNYELLQDAAWERKFVECGDWGLPEMRHLFQNVGYEVAQCQPDVEQPMGKDDIEALPSIEAALILHNSHSNHQYMGNAYLTTTRTLFPPAVVISHGCHSAGIDEPAPSAAGTILGRGAVVFMGTTRSPIAKGMYIDIAFAIALLKPGQTVGEASKSALNSAITLFEKQEDVISMDRYSIENHIVLGDPALVPLPARETPRKKAAGATFNDDVVIVEGPAEWQFTKYHPSVTREWKEMGAQYCPSTLFIPTAPGVSSFMEMGTFDWNDVPGGGGVRIPGVEGNPNRVFGFGPYNVTTPCMTVTIKSSEQIHEQQIVNSGVTPLDGTDVNEEGTELGTYPFLNSRDCTPKLDQYMEPDGTHVTTFILRMLDSDDRTGRVLRAFRRAQFKVHNAGKIISVTTM